MLYILLENRPILSACWFSGYLLGFSIFFFFNSKFESLTDLWSIIVPLTEPPDHIHLH
ncbi:hypothetical protein Hanom_Chr17g01568911 [Helianthus anomalus]